MHSTLRIEFNFFAWFVGDWFGTKNLLQKDCYFLRLAWEETVYFHINRTKKPKTNEKDLNGMELIIFMCHKKMLNSFICRSNFAQMPCVYVFYMCWNLCTILVLLLDVLSSTWKPCTKMFNFIVRMSVCACASASACIHIFVNLYIPTFCTLYSLQAQQRTHRFDYQRVGLKR